MKKGVFFAIGSYVLWGLFPLYWKQLETVPAREIVAHRILWSFVFILGVMILMKRVRGLWESLRRPRVPLTYAASAILLSINWLTYIWGVNSGYIVEASLGYFINPLVSVLLGVIFFRERLRPVQWIAIGLAAVGVGYLTVHYGSPPWIGLILAFSFGTYGLIKKRAFLEALEGQTLEMALLFIPALLFLLYLERCHAAVFGHTDPGTVLLLALGGVVTAVPLLMFAAAARRIPLSMIGILQYIAPTLQFSIGVWVYNENFSTSRLIGFCFIWSALLIYTLEGLYRRRKVRIETSVEL